MPKPPPPGRSLMIRANSVIYAKSLSFIALAINAALPRSRHGRVDRLALALVPLRSLFTVRRSPISSESLERVLFGAQRLKTTDNFIMVMRQGISAPSRPIGLLLCFYFGALLWRCCGDVVPRRSFRVRLVRWIATAGTRPGRAQIRRAPAKVTAGRADMMTAGCNHGAKFDRERAPCSRCVPL